MAFWSKKRPPPAVAAPAPAKPQYAAEPEREALRARHNVRELTAEEDGTGWQRLPSGIYGFVFVPVLGDFPLFRTAKLHNFEVHKVGPSELLLVGYASPEAAAQLEIRLCPDPRQDASMLVSIPLARVIKIKETSAREDGSLALQLEPGAVSRSHPS
jgi:hypothetical protein